MFVVAFPAFFALNEACPVPVIVLQKVGALPFRGMEISRCATLASAYLFTPFEGPCYLLSSNKSIHRAALKS